MYTETVESFSDFISKTQELRQQHGTLWWRGQCKERDWKLVASVHRYKDAVEQGLTMMFRQKALARYDKCPAMDDRLDWLFLMQHHGLPTRLLDWTESPLIAAFFACEDPDKKYVKEDAVIWSLNPLRLNEIMVKKKTLIVEYDGNLVLLMLEPFCTIYRRGLPIVSMVTTADTFPGEVFVTEATPKGAVAFASDEDVEDHPIKIPRNAYQHVVALNSTERSPRSAAQLSRFTIHRDATPLDEYPGADDCLFKLTIPCSVKEEISRTLDSMGISRLSLFPDLDNLAVDLTRRICSCRLKASL